MKKDIRDYKVNGKQYAYILDAISPMDNDGNYIENVKDEDKIRFFFDTYEEEWNYEGNRKRFPVPSERIGEYIKGLPSCIHIAFADYDIIEIGHAWGFCNTSRKEREFKSNFHRCIGLRLLQMKEYFGIKKNENGKYGWSVSNQ